MKRTRSDKPKLVLSFTRRSDGVANEAQLAAFLAGLKAGAIPYAHPKVRAPTPPRRQTLRANLASRGL